MDSKLNITFDEKIGFSVKYNDFEADRFFSGYVLFQAVLRAYQQYDLASKEIPLDQFMRVAKSQVPAIKNNIVDDFDFTWSRYVHNSKNRTLIYEWDSSESWSFILELEKHESGYSLIFSVAGGDYDVPFSSGWDCYDDFVGNITNTPYPELEDHKEDEYFGFNALIDSSVLDADGKFVFLVQTQIKSFNDITMLNYLRNDIDDLIIDDDVLMLINNRVKKLLNEDGNN
jgi:hypothetical protein